MLPHWSGNIRGLVPGGKYFYADSPGVYILDRNSVALASQKPMRSWDLRDIQFSSQGEYYAVAAVAKPLVREKFAPYSKSRSS